VRSTRGKTLRQKPLDARELAASVLPALEKAKNNPTVYRQKCSALGVDIS
jgi:hypothetical protein